MYFLLEKVDFQPAILVYQRLHGYPIFWQEIHWPSSAIPATCRRESHKIHKILILKGEVEKMWKFESLKFGAKKIGSFAQKMHEDLIKDILTIVGFHRLWLSMKIYAIRCFWGAGINFEIWKNHLNPWGILEAATPQLKPWPQFKSRCLPRNSQTVILWKIDSITTFHHAWALGWIWKIRAPTGKCSQPFQLLVSSGKNGASKIWSRFPDLELKSFS